MNSPKVNHPSENSGPKTNQLVDWLNASEDRLVAVVFTAPWSGSGAILHNFMGKITREMPDIFVKWIDVDDNAELAAKLGINQIPSVVLLRHHEVVDHVDGMLPRSRLVARMLPFV